MVNISVKLLHLLKEVRYIHATAFKVKEKKDMHSLEFYVVHKYMNV
jgi:hypothetical protein